MDILQSIRLADQYAASRFRREAKITRSQYLVLKALEDVNSSNLSQITKKTGIDRATITPVLRRLQNQNLVSVETNTNGRRSYKVKLKPAGKRLLQKVKPIASQIESDFVDRVGARNKKIIVNALSSIVGAAA